MSTPSNPLAAGVPALQPPKPTQAMISPDGKSVADIPVENVQAAIKGGYKMGVDMVGPDGSSATIPVDSAHDAVTKGGYKPAGQTSAAGSGMETSIAPKIVRGATSTLPAVGATTAGVLATPETGGLGTAVGVGLGAAAGKSAELGINNAIFGGEPHPTDPTNYSKEGLKDTAITGLIAGGTEGALQMLPGAASKAGDLYDKAKDLVNFNPSELHAGIREVADDAAGIATTGSVRASLEQAGDTVLAKSKGLYDEIDQATGGKWSANEAELKNVNDELRDTLGVDTAKDSKLIIQKQRLELQSAQMIDDMEAAGVPKETVDAAKQNYKQAQALYDVDAAVKSTTPIGKETVATMKRSEQVNPKALLPKLQKLYDTGRLQQAVGEDGAAKLLGHAEDADILARAASRNAKIAKTVATMAGTGVVGGEIAKHAIGE